MARGSSAVVIGGGVIGCAVAFYAARRGLDVTLVDNPKRVRATSASAAGLWPLGESVGLGCGVIFYRAAQAARPHDGGHAGPERLPKSFLDFALAFRAMFRALVDELREATGTEVEFEKTSLLFVMYDDGDRAFARGQGVPGRAHARGPVRRRSAGAPYRAVPVVPVRAGAGAARDVAGEPRAGHAVASR